MISIIQEWENISEINTYTIGDDFNDEKCYWIMMVIH